MKLKGTCALVRTSTYESVTESTDIILSYCHIIISSCHHKSTFISNTSPILTSFYFLFFVIRIINTVISGSSAFLCGLIYISVTCLDEKYPHWNHGSKFRSMMILKCFLCGECKKLFNYFYFRRIFFSLIIFFLTTHTVLSKITIFFYY